MDNSFGAKVRKAAENVAEKLSEAAQNAGEHIGEMREVQRLTARIRTLQHERAACKAAMADLAIRMFDQNAFTDTLLRPEYERIKAIDGEIARLEEEKQQVGKAAEAAQPCASEETMTSEPVSTEAPPPEVRIAPDEAELLPQETTPAEPRKAESDEDLSDLGPMI